MVQFKKSPVTVSLVGLTCLIFLWEIYYSNNQTNNAIALVKMGAQYGPLISDGHQYWRLITPIFLHVGWEHLILNMVVLWFVGIMAEKDFGSLRFGLIYIGSGICGNLLSWIMQPFTVSVGASTATFGMLGALLVYVLKAGPHNPEAASQRTWLISFLVLNLLSSLFVSNIDLWGHLGGLLGGLGLAWLLLLGQRWHD